MINIIYYIKTDKVKTNGESPIYAKITLENKSISFSTSKSISFERWNQTNKLNNSLKLEKEKMIKMSLDHLKDRIEKSYYHLYKLDNDISLQELKQNLTGKTIDNSIYLLPLFDKHNDYFKLKVTTNERSSASLQKYMRSKDLIQSFLKKKYGSKDIDVTKINSAFIYNLESYLKYESEYKGKTGIKNNSVVKYFKNFKTICNYAIKMDLIQKNPFDYYSGKINVQEATFLTQAELDTIENKIFDAERLERVKDIFLFSCYTGYAPIDACTLTHENLIKDGNDNLWIKANRAKTGTKANVPVLKSSKRIIEKYSGKQTGLIPKLSNQKMNAYFKEIADLCGIKKHLTWYVSRHTFATTVTLGNGIKIENVSAMMGHSSIKQTQHYAKILDANVMDDMSRIMEKYK